MNQPDGQHCSADLVSQMKHSLRLRSGVVALFLVAVGTILCCRTAVRRADLAGRPLQLLDEAETAAAAASSSPPPLNASLMRLASVDPGDELLRRELEQLVEGSFTGRDPLYRSFASWRRFHHHSEHEELHPERRMQSKSVLRDIPGRLLRSPRDYRVFPELRRVARDWLRRGRFHPDVMSQLVDLVKRPLDLHNAALRSGEDPSSSTAGAGRYGSCAVVGNSGILLNSEHGHLIDGHDLVIRLNNARTRGFERNVGSRTSLAFINSNILHLCARRETCFCHPYGEHVPIIMYICQAAHFLDFTVCNASHKAPLLVTDPRFDRLCARIVKYYSLKRFAEGTGKPPEEWDNAHDAKMFHYSSGMQAVVAALGICDRVSVFGFGKSPEAKHHYHTNQKAELSLHDYDAEYAFYRDLAERPQVIPVLMESGFRVPPVVMYQ